MNTIHPPARTRKLMLTAVVVVVLLALGLLINAVLPFRIVAAALKSKASFTHCAGDARVLCEPGSEALGKASASHLDDAVATVARLQHGSFPKPIVVYTYATAESFLAHTGYSHPRATVINGAIHVSPTALREPMRLLVIHEMSHLAFYQATGMLTMAQLPTWFVEGLATYVASGGGAGDVTAEGAARRMAEGMCIRPETSHSLLKLIDRVPADISARQLYRQGAMLVAYLHEVDPPAFERLMAGLAGEEHFADAITSAYGVPMSVLWPRFLEHTRNEINRDYDAGLGPLCAAFAASGVSGQRK